jgi:hypothetical protein
MVRAIVRHFLKFWGVIVDLLLLLISGFGPAVAGISCCLSSIGDPSLQTLALWGAVGFLGHAACASNH